MPLAMPVLDELRRVVGRESVIDSANDLRIFERDASIEGALPDAVVLASTTAEVAGVIKVAAKHRIPVVPRGAGTGLSGGAVTIRGGIALQVTRMRGIEIDPVAQTALVEPGVVNQELSLVAASHGLFYAPDPSSQKACTIGGNVAENSGGPHTLAYGVTVNHITGLEIVLPDGRIVHLGGKATRSAGYDLTGFFIGSEGTLGIATAITVKMTRLPEAVATLLAIYNDVPAAANTVVGLTSAGITPAAIEMLDGWTLRAVEASVHAGYPLDSAAVLLIELEGLREVVEEQSENVLELCRRSGAREVRRARDENERQLLWKGRKTAFGAIGRISPSYYVQDGVIPRTRIPETLRKIDEISRKYALTIGNIFHAGDGNLHPLILFDARDPDQTQRTLEAGREILEFCIGVGGSITGEHGVGMEKQDLMCTLFNDSELEVMKRLRDCFNPDSILNPQKILPSARTCREAVAPGDASLNSAVRAAPEPR